MEIKTTHFNPLLVRGNGEESMGSQTEFGNKRSQKRSLGTRKSL